MKIAVTSEGSELISRLDQRFGRAAKFIVYDVDASTYTVANNVQNLNAAQGAGIQAAQLVDSLGVQIVITGHCGPKAFRVLQAAGIGIYTSDAQTVRDALDLFQAGKLREIDSPNVEGHWL